ncbi:MAG: CHAT domain-containing protein, partial [Novosphingobium sp.]
VAARFGEGTAKHADAIQLHAAEYYLAHRWDEAAALLRKALAIRRAVQGDGALDTLYVGRTTAEALHESGHDGDARTILRGLLAAPVNEWSARYTEREARARLGRSVENIAMGRLRAYHAMLELESGGASAEAARSARLAAQASQAMRDTLGSSVLDESQLDLAERTNAFTSPETRFGEWDRLLADALWAQGNRDPATLGEVFTALQDVASGATSRSVAKSAAARVAAETGAGPLITQRDAKAAEAVRATSEAGRLSPGTADESATWSRVLALQDEVDALDARIAVAAPNYFALTRARPLDPAAARALMGAEEAALILVPGERGTHLLLVDHEGLAWHRASLAEPELNQKVRRLLWDVGANVDASEEENARWSAEGAGPSPFDRGTAHLLYRELIAPFETRLSGKKHLAIIGSGALSSLPFSLLVAAPPQGLDGDPQALRDTAWLGERFALIQLPSLQALQLLRLAGQAKPAPRARFVGYGDPVLDGVAEDRGLGGKHKRGAPVPAAAMVSTSEEGTASLADVAALRTMARLPGTARELAAMRAEFPPASATVHLAEDATEARLKRDDLTGLSVLALSTHGLLAGEAGQLGVAQPGLVLTPPAKATPLDDGLLTAAEIAALRTDASWVVLSACNTAAGDGTSGAEGLSGLAKAFFFAGAESLLASHWPVRDDVAAVVTVKVLELEKAHPGWSRAQALQAAEKAIRDDPAADGDLATWAHPSAWAPFSYIGDWRR